MDLKTYLTERPRGEARVLARAVGVNPVMVSEWLRGVKTPPGDRCTAIEQATQGAVTCEVLRPDLSWVRVTDPDWPWHPNGRPLLDLTAAQSVAATGADARQAA